MAQRTQQASGKTILRSPFASTWLLVDQHKTGTRNQGVGLLEAMGIPYEVLSVVVSPLARMLPRSAWPLPWIKISESGECLTPPWPQLIFAGGTVATLAAAKIRKASRGNCVVVALQNPRLDLALFDWVIAPAHDELKGENVLETHGALHAVTPQRIEEELSHFRGAFEHLPHPLVAVLIGGPNRHLSFGQKEAERLGEDLTQLHQQTGCGFLVNCSRRTPVEVFRVMENLTAKLPMFLWKGEGRSPYFAYLGMADYVLVTRDSVSMLSDAAATDKPVFIYQLPGNAPKFDRLHQRFEALGICRPFRGKLEFWARAPLLETPHMAVLLKERLAGSDRR